MVDLGGGIDPNLARSPPAVGWLGILEGLEVVGGRDAVAEVGDGGGGAALGVAVGAGAGAAEAVAYQVCTPLCPEQAPLLALAVE